MTNPFEEFEKSIASYTPEDLARLDAELEAKLSDPNYVPREVEWRDDPDPLGMDWAWAEPPAKDLANTAEKVLPDVETTPVIFLGRPGRRPLSRRVAYGVGGTIAASLLVGVGVLIGSSMFRMEVLVATVTPDLGTARGPGNELRIEIQAGRPGFATLISLAPGRRQEVFPKPGSADFRLDESGSSTVGPLPPDTQMAVVVITETRSSDAVRKALSAKDYRAGDLTQLQPDLVKALSKRGDRWASIGISEFPRTKKP